MSKRSFWSILRCLLLCFSMCAANVYAGLPHRLIQGEQLPSLAPVIEATSPAVVNIATYSVQKRYSSPLLQSPFFRHFFDIPDHFDERRQVQSAGSGVIVDAQAGYVLTNHHVLGGSSDIEVTLQDGRRYKAKLMGSDKKVDLALLQIDAPDLKALMFADSDALKVGDIVLAIGNPFGLSQTVTSGIVSALGRNGLGIQGFEDFIQTDASINPGNSGGALIDLRGRLVGINSAIIAPAGGNVGIGFAIPTNVARAIMQQLIQYGEVRRGGIGARFQDLTPELADAFGLSTFQGALIAKVDPDSAASEAGLKAGDIITQANGRPVTSAADMHHRIGLSPLGQILKLKLLRQGKTLDREVEIRAIPIPSAKGAELSPYLAGSVLQDVLPPDQEDPIGVMVTDVIASSAAARIGLQTGDVIYGVNRSRIRSIAELKAYLSTRAPQALRLRRAYEDLILYIR